MPTACACERGAAWLVRWEGEPESNVYLISDVRNLIILSYVICDFLEVYLISFIT